MEPRTESEPRRVHADVVVPHRILAATDLGPVGDAAIQVAHARASEVGGKLAVCHVAHDLPDDPDEQARKISEIQRELYKMLEATLGGVANDVEVFVPIGDTAKEIHDCAEQWNAELVVIGRPDNPGGIL